MPRPRAPHGTYAAYRRHLREKTAVCGSCRAAQHDTDRDRNAKKAEEPVSGVAFVPDDVAVEAPEADSPRIDRLRWNLRLVETAMATVDPGKLAMLSKQHAALLEEIDGLEKATEPTRDALDEFIGAPNVVGISTAPSRIPA